MQKDMHYYGVYVLARCAGLNEGVAHTIATASQFVDDAGTNASVTFLDASMLDVEATAHHIFHVKNLDPHDQRRIWVPFHFYPGGEGETFTEKLLCRKDSVLAREMVKTNVEKAKTVPFGDALIGVTAHVYADTFAHYDFSGVSSRLNRIEGELETYDLNEETKTYVEHKKKRFFKENGEHGGLLANIKGFFGGNLSGALGHGAAATYPDRPYLRWSLEWEDAKGRVQMRDNRQTFLEACERLYDLFVEYGQGSPDHFAPRPFDEVRDAIQAVIETQGKCADREKAWCDLLASGQATGVSEEMPDYAGDEWLMEFVKLRALEDGSFATQKPVVQFFQAAAFHRQTSLRDILPRHGLIVG